MIKPLATLVLLNHITVLGPFLKEVVALLGGVGCIMPLVIV